MMSAQNGGGGAKPNGSSHNPPYGASTVLVVDDTDDRLVLMAAILRQAGYRVLTARDGQEGFELAAREFPDLVISDVSMPRVDGIQLCQMIRAHEELGLMPVLLVSAIRKDAASIVEGLQIGAFDYLEAPYDPKHLIAKVDRLVELSETERALREREERYREMVENARDIIYTHDLTGRFTSLNRAGEQITGYSREEAQKMNISDVIAPEYLEQALQMVKQKLEGGDTTIHEIEIVSKHGRRVTIEINSRPIYENGVVVGIQGIARDITERRQTEEALRQKEEQFRQSQKLEAVGQLAGGVAHDFNNLLTVITGYSDLILRRSTPDDSTRQKVEEIKKAAERASSLTRQLLAFSRKQVLQPKIINLNELVIGVVNMLRRLIGEDIELITVLREDVGQVNADPSQIEQVLINLVVNARDAMPQGGKMVIETVNVELDESYANQHNAVKPGEYVMLAVSDTGAGIDQETLKHIFEPFFTTKEPSKGTGLGLSTVYGIVKQSGGNIWLYSEPGMGTTFKIYLPLVLEEAEQIAPPVSEEIKGGTETILLVEDAELVRRLTRNILLESNYQVLEAANGEEALRVAEQYSEQIHLMVTDVVMPLMSGKELANRIAEKHPEIRVLFMSGYTDEAIVHHGVLDPGIEFLAKPFTYYSLTKKVREILDKHN